MTLLEDRVLEHALAAHFGGERDLAAEIARRWERGEGGSLDTAELEAAWHQLERELAEGDAGPVPSHRARPAPGPRPFGPGAPGAPAAPPPASAARRRRLWLGAALAAALWGMVLGITFWRGGPAPPPGGGGATEWATAEGPLRVVRDGTLLTVADGGLSGGDGVWLEPGGPGVSLPGGARVFARGPALVRLSPGSGDSAAPDLEVLHGSIGLASGSGELALRTRGVRLALAAGTVADLGARSSLSWTDAPDAGAPLEPDAILALAADPRADERGLLVTARTGRVSVAAADRGLDLAAPDEAAIVGRGWSVPAPLWDEFVLLADQLYPKRYSMLDPPFGIEQEEAAAWRDRLRGVLLGWPSLWDVFVRRCERGRPGGTPDLYLPALLDFLVEMPGEEAFAWARALWLERPEEFRPHHVTILAERGAFEFEREARARVAAWIEDPEAFDEEPVLSATFLALRGDGDGRALLDEVLQAAKPETLRDGTLLLVACGLEALGADGAWELAVRHTVDAAETLLARGDDQSCLHLLLSLETLRDLREEPGGALLGSFGPRLREARAERAEELLADRAALVALLEAWRAG